MNNTQYHDHEYLFGKVLSVECDNGYRIAKSHDNNIITGNVECGPNGTWNETITCEKKVCSSSSMNNTQYHDHEYLFGKVLSVECENGYRIAKSHDNNIITGNVECGPNGTWNETITCEKKVCSSSSMNNTQYHDHEYLFGKVLSVECENVCSSSSMNNTQYHDHEYLFEKVLSVECENGYRIAKSHDNNIITGNVECGPNGTWNETITCEKKVCSSSSMNNTQYHDHEYLFGKVLSVECENVCSSSSMNNTQYHDHEYLFEKVLSVECENVCSSSSMNNTQYHDHEYLFGKVLSVECEN
ncbi:CFAH-like protein, partial [Mya arenaria]